VDLGGRSYDVHVGEGAIAAALGDAVGRSTPRRVALLADERVAPDHAARVRDAIGERVELLEHLLPAGEAAKTLSVVEQACRALVAAGLERGDLVVGLGGGAATDAAGLVAALHLRGVAWVSVPTSLLGMVDAAVGGKTAVNLPEGKNLVGAFWQPSAVGCEPATLATLPAREFRAGLAEVVKTAWIGDPELLEFVEDSPPLDWSHPSVPEIVRRCVSVKARIVSQDEREGGLRAVLNFGHTLGHAIETEAAGRWLHGEAVALGLVAAVHLSVAAHRCEEPVLDRLVTLLERLGLPTRDAELDPERVLDRARRDKKRAAGRDRYLLTAGVGSVSVATDPVSGARRAALEFLRR
jgi:3-dehydroquinate synthase